MQLTAVALICCDHATPIGRWGTDRCSNTCRYKKDLDTVNPLTFGEQAAEYFRSRGWKVAAPLESATTLCPAHN